MRPQSLQRNTDNLILGYLLVTGGLAFVHRGQVAGGWKYPCIHLAAAASVFLLRFLPGKLSPVARFFRDWYPVIAFPLLYKEVEIFAAGFGNWDLTGPIRRWEAALFGGQPSLLLSERLPYIALSEFLHFCYFSHVLLFPAVAGYWYHSRRSAFRELLFLVSVSLLTSYLFFILFPVDSPFYLGPPLPAPLPGHPFHDLVHFVADRGGARGGAFPSTHVSVTTVIWLVAWRRQRRVAYLLAPIAAGLIFATVYGRFHYSLDVFAGMALAATVVGVYSYRTSTAGTGRLEAGSPVDILVGPETKPDYGENT